MLRLVRAARSTASSVSACSARCSNVVRVGCSRVLTTMTVGCASWAMVSGNCPEQRTVGGIVVVRCGGADDHQLGAFRLAHDGLGDVLALHDERPAALRGMAMDERGQGALGLGADRGIDVGRQHVQDVDRRVERARQGIGEVERQLGMWSAADRSEDAFDMTDAALLDDGDVARRVAHDLVDGRAEDRCPGTLSSARSSAPAEEDELRLFLGGQLDDALGGSPADAHDGPHLHARSARTRAPAGAAGAPGAPWWRPPRGPSPLAPRRCPAR